MLISALSVLIVTRRRGPVRADSHAASRPCGALTCALVAQGLLAMNAEPRP